MITKFFTRLTFLFVVLLAPQTRAKFIVVNTANNISPAPGETNLIQAIQLLEDGDTIQFNIPGTGPFYLATPPLVPDNGFPAITHHNVTIDGYSQPGALPNSNSILSSNNAKIQIAIDSRNSFGRVENIPGYGTSEASTFLIKGATNVTLRGLCFLGAGVGDDTDSDPSTYAISFALGSNFGRVNGCWIGVDVNGTDVHRFRAGITGFKSDFLIDDLTVGVSKDAADIETARGQFNLIIGEYVPIIVEGRNLRISGNFLNVFPDGITDFNINGLPPNDIEACVEIGRAGDNLVLGTDGDGNHDHEERNIFGGVTVSGDGQIIEWYGGARTNMVIAGNYFGMGVDGTTRFTNSMKIFGGLGSSATVRVGSDFNGVSDDLEGNVIAMNFPFDELFPAPSRPGPPQFADPEPGARFSLRGNRLIGNNIAPYSFANGFGNRLNSFADFYQPFLVTNQIIPVLFTNTTHARLKGSCALGAAPYTNIFIDVYLGDEEGWTNGQKFELSELMRIGDAAFDGFAQGKTYLATFTENGPQDLNDAPGQFEFDISSLNLASAFITVSANYSSDAPGVSNGRAQTTPFATPVIVQPLPVVAIEESGGIITLSWPTNFGTYNIQSSETLSPSDWADLNPQPVLNQVGNNYRASIPTDGDSLFLRLNR